MGRIKPYRDVYIEICDICNAKCPFCDTGMRKIGLLPKLPRNGDIFMSPLKFARIIEYLANNGFITKDSTIYPFNFGEPFLHPDLNIILFTLEKFGLGYFLSTNGSVEPKKPVNFRLDHLRRLVFSMSGFGQESYRKIHGLDFDRIKKNILSIQQMYREAGFEGVTEIAAHQYAFNADEQEALEQFAFANGMRVRSNLAVPLSMETSCAYLDGSLNDERKANIEQKLKIDAILSHMNQRPAKFVCNSIPALTISSQGHALQCCWTSEHTPGNDLGDVTTLSLEEVRQKREDNQFCQNCIKLGADYFMSGWPERTIKERPADAQPCSS